MPFPEPRPHETKIYLQDAREWHKRKKQAFAVAYAYDELGLTHTATQIRKCALDIHFDVFADNTRAVFRRPNEFNYFCRQRHCPLCQMRRSLKSFYQLEPVYSRHVKDFPRQRAIHMVLTVPNMWGDALEDELNAMKEGIRRLTRCKDFKSRVTGWYRALEITWNSKRFDFNPHIHAALMMDEDYFKSNGDPGSLYLHQKEWLRLWQRSMGRTDIKVLWVERVRMPHFKDGDADPAKLLWELTKYVTKPSSFIPYNPQTRHYECDPEVLYYLHHALRGRHLTAKGGNFRRIHSELTRLASVPLEASFSPSVDPHGDDPYWLAEESYAWRKQPDGSSGYVLCTPTLNSMKGI